MSGARGPRYKQLPLWRDAMRFLVEVEQAVRAFPRYHKYTLGHELRTQAMAVCKLVARAAQSDDQRQRLQMLDSLVWLIDDLKMSIQLAKELEAFASFAQFQRMAEQSVVLGKQSGGWRKQARSAVQAASAPGAAGTAGRHETPHPGLGLSGRRQFVFLCVPRTTKVQATQ